MPPALRHTAGCPSGQRERSVKPSAQPTLVRTQHLPPPAKTARWLRKRGPAGRFFSVPPCVILYRCGAACRGVHGRIADGIRAPSRSVRTVGCFTDGHGRAALMAFSGLEVNGEAGRASPCAATRRSARLPGARRPDGTGDRRQRSPRALPPGRPPVLRITKISGTVGVQDAVTERPPAPGPLPQRLSRNVTYTTGSAVPNPRQFGAADRPVMSFNAERSPMRQVGLPTSKTDMA